MLHCLPRYRIFVVKFSLKSRSVYLLCGLEVFSNSGFLNMLLLELGLETLNLLFLQLNGFFLLPERILQALDSLLGSASGHWSLCQLSLLLSSDITEERDIGIALWEAIGKGLQIFELESGLLLLGFELLDPFLKLRQLLGLSLLSLWWPRRPTAFRFPGLRCGRLLVLLSLVRLRTVDDVALCQGSAFVTNESASPIPC